MDVDDAVASRVAVLGLGRMGIPLAVALLEGLGSVVVWNRSRYRADDLALAHPGVVVASTPGEAARDSDVVITMLADGAALMSVLESSDGVLSAARPGTVVVDMGTSGPETVRRAADLAASHDVTLVDAPVSGSVAAVTSRSLLVMAGGTEADVAAVRPVLELVARRVVHVGPTGSGAVLKLCVNSLLVTLNAGVGEALRMAELCGVDREAAYDVFADSAAGAPFLTYKRAAFLEPDRGPVAFSLDLVAKDVALALALGAEAGVDTPVLEAVAQQVEDIRSQGRGGEDMSSVAWREG